MKWKLSRKPDSKSAAPSPDDRFNKMWFKLPDEVRGEIFRLCGIIRGDEIPLNPPRRHFRNWGRYEWYQSEKIIHRKEPVQSLDEYQCQDPWCPRCNLISNQLFYVSKALSEDTRKFFYSRNAFRIVLSAEKEDRGTNSFVDLPVLTPFVVSSLRWLQVEIRCKDYIPPELPRNGVDNAILYKIDNVNLSWNAKLMLDWDRLCLHLSNNLTPQALDLRMKINTVSLDVFQKIMQHTKKLAPLKNISICVSRSFRQGFQDAVRNAVLDLQTSSQNQIQKQPNSHIALPAEVLENVIRQSELVAPVPLDWRYGWEFYDQDSTCQCPWDIEPFSDACFTAPNHIAYSTSLPHWSNPTELFEIAPDVARRIFYSKNVFRVEVDFGTQDSCDYHEKAHRNVFLRGFPKDSLWYLTHIHWHICDWEVDSMIGRSGDSGTPSLEPVLDAAIQLIKKNCRPWLLTMSVSVEVDYAHSRVNDIEFLESRMKVYSDLAEKFRPLVTQVDADAMDIERCNAPRSQKRGLQDFFFYLDACFTDFLKGDRESVLEKKLMGDEYDSSAHKLGRQLLCVPDRVQVYGDSEDEDSTDEDDDDASESDVDILTDSASQVSLGA